MANGRQKGAAFERLTCKLLTDELGESFKFRRDLEQYREGQHSDIICDDPNFPFAIECKRYASGEVRPEWWSQAIEAAERAEKEPALVYKFDRRPIMVRLHIASLSSVWEMDHDLWCHVTWDNFIYLCREKLSDRTVYIK